MDNIKTTDSEVSELVYRLLEAQKEHDKNLDEISEYSDGVDLAIRFDSVYPIADLLGVPKDNTVETNACEIMTDTGEWPEDAYCRDWIYYRWNECLSGEVSIFSFVQEMLAEREKGGEDE